MKTALLGILCSTFWYAQPLGEGKQSVPLEVKFSQLEDGQESYEVEVNDGGVKTVLVDANFMGHTNVSGIRKETDDSINTIDLVSLRSLHIDEPHYNAKALSDKEFCLAHAISNNGIKSDGLLIPRNIVLSGIEKGTRIHKCWHLHRINSLQVLRVLSPGERVAQVIEPHVRTGKVMVTPATTTPEAVTPASNTNPFLAKQTTEPLPAAEQPHERLSDYAPKSIKSALAEIVSAFIGLVKAIIGFIKKWIW